MNGEYLTGIIEKTRALSRTQEEIQAPKKYKVILLNDDYTPMDFVVEVLKRFFRLNDAIATQLMLEVHFKGYSVCGIFTRDIAETKVAQVNEYAKSNEYPLRCTMESE
ncbi:MAG: ATP-dependent Clp protease adapter ClpS [Legionellaceae bacterium]|nr:ATP-dependent Clp protease adapter ClpS [Legionellaceae bacterium]